MSTAAPAAGAPAPASPAAAPSAPGEAAGTPEGQSARSIKPIPDSRPRLPGVLEDGPEDARTRPPREQGGRDPATGRFVKGGGEAPVIPGHRPEPSEPGPGDPTPDVIPELPGESKPFMFAGKSFKSQAEAEHWAKSMEGRYKPIQEAATRHEAQLVKAAESARGWHAEAQRLQAEIAELRAGKQPSQPEGQTPPEGGIDWALYADIVKVANESGEPWKAQQWLMEQYDAVRKADFERYRQEFEAPFREREATEAEAREHAQAADAIVSSLVDYKGPDGQPAFPEASDGDTMRAVGELWVSLGLDPRIALTPGGSVAAISLYRLSKSLDGAAAPPADPNPAPPPPDPAAAAAAALEGGRPLLPAAQGRRELDPGVARIVAGLKNTQLLRPGLGFEA